MKIGIVIAIARELKIFLESNFKIETEIVNNREIYKTKIKNNEVYAIKSGYGVIDAASATQLLITKYGVDTIINFGVTGAIVKGLKVSDLFYVDSAVNYTYDVSTIDPVKPGQYEDFDDIFIPLDKSLINLVKEKYPNLQKAIVASGDKFIEKIEDKNYLAKTFSCNICDMEIAAIARTCYLNNVKCLSIKCISDSLEGSGVDFNTNVSNSAEKAFKIIEDLLLNL